MKPARRIEPPPDLDPALAEFIAELARAAVRREIRHGKKTDAGGDDVKDRD
jgi:hypothetical protein